MKVYLTPPQHSLGLERIATALRRYAPSSVEVLSFPRNADLTVIYAIGRRDAVWRQVRDIQNRGKRYAIVQVCLRSTMSPRTRDWWDIWRGAVCVWSYYDLVKALNDDGFFGGDIDDLLKYPGINFYHAPLGADAGVFYPRGTVSVPRFIVATSGLSRLSESVRECLLAAERVGRGVLHVGPLMNWSKPGVFFTNGVSDESLAKLYSDCTFVSALRRKEGFELPAVEGLLCGARPITFDTPDYRWIYQDFAEYIEETDRQGVIDQLVELFKRGARPVTTEERERAVERFSWETIIDGFWQRAL